jgi:hypothetical protein
MENNRSLILSLIKEDLRCNKLVLGLSGLGLDAGKYHTELSTVVFNLMGIDHNNDQLLSLYFDCIDKATGIEDVEDQKLLQSMAEEIYEKLEVEKQNYVS